MYLPLTAWLAETRTTATLPKLRVTILYECLDAGKRAKRFSDELAADQTIDLSVWSFRVLGIREVRNVAASTAAAADLVILSLSGEKPLAAPVQEWIEMWTWLIEDHRPAVVALMASPDAEGARIRSYLRRGAAGKRLPFFAPTPGAIQAKKPAGKANDEAGVLRSSNPPTFTGNPAAKPGDLQ